MKNLIAIILLLGLLSCSADEPKVCGCLGYDESNKLTEVVCDDCDKGINEATCQEYNEQNRSGLSWEYNEADECPIAEPQSP